MHTTHLRILLQLHGNDISGKPFTDQKVTQPFCFDNLNVLLRSSWEIFWDTIDFRIPRNIGFETKTESNLVKFSIKFTSVTDVIYH